MKSNEGFYYGHLNHRTILRLILLLAFGITVVNMFTSYNLLFHSDTAAANILAREQLLTHQLFPDTWYTSTGLFIFFYNVLMVPLSFLIHDQLVLRSTAVLIILLSVVLLLRDLSKKQMKSDFYLLVLCLFFSGTSGMVVDMGYAQAAYLISLMDSIILLILFIKALTPELKIKSRAFFGVFLLYVLYLSTYGLLNFAYQIFPLLGAIGLYFVLEHSKQPFKEVKVPAWNLLKIIAGIAVATCAGVAVYLYLASITGFASGTNTIYVDYSSLANQFVAFVLNAIGFQANVALFSLQGIMNAVIIFAYLAMVVCCVLLFRKYGGQRYEVKIVMLFSLVMFVIFLYFDFFIYCTHIGNVRYLFKPIFFLYLLSGYYLHEHVLKQGFMVKLVTLAGVAVFALPCQFAMVPQIAKFGPQHEQQLSLVRFLEDHELTQGYATFWNAGNNMVLSNFQVEIAGVFLLDTIVPHNWLTSQRYYEQTDEHGRTFLLLTQEEDVHFQASKSYALLGVPRQTLAFGNYIIYVYPYNIAQDGFMGHLEQPMELKAMLHVSDDSMRVEDGSIQLSENQVIFGPYMTTSAGNYQIKLAFSALDGEVFVRLTANSGQEIIQGTMVSEKETIISCDIAETKQDFEIVMTTSGTATLASAQIIRLS